jgi:hypothetical protein
LESLDCADLWDKRRKSYKELQRQLDSAYRITLRPKLSKEEREIELRGYLVATGFIDSYPIRVRLAFDS